MLGGINTKITKLFLSDFGKFHQQEFTLSSGLNIATGPNESGKTTLRMFIRSMLYGLERERGIKARKDAYTRLKPWEYGRFQGILEFESGGRTYRLFRNFLTTEKEVVLTDLASGRQIEDVPGFLRECGLKPVTVYTNTFWVGNDCAADEVLGTELKDFLANLASGGGKLNLQKSLEWLSARKKEILRQVPEQELAKCLEVLFEKDALSEKLGRSRSNIEVHLRHEKALQAAIKAQRDKSVQLSEERKETEILERQKYVGERLLTLFCTVGAGMLGIACFLPGIWPSLALGGIGLAAAVCGLVLGLPKIRTGKEVAAVIQELEEEFTFNNQQLESCYAEMTRLLPMIEQEKLRAEQLEEQLKQCELAAERYDELKVKKQELLLEAEAIQLAAETLEQLSNELYEEFGARFAASLSDYAKAFTDHSYDTLTADEDLNLKAITNERSLELSEVSHGTGEQFYLALRFAAADVFDPEKKNMILLDDSFAAFDEQRLESAVLALSRCGRQVLVLSSTGREEAAAKRMGIKIPKMHGFSGVSVTDGGKFT